MPSTIIAVETLPHLRRAEFEGRPLPGAASAGVESQTGVLRPSVAESRGHSWTPGGGPRVGEQLGGGRRHGYAQAHGRESAAGVDFIAPQTPVSWAAPVGVAHASTSAAQLFRSLRARLTFPFRRAHEPCLHELTGTYRRDRPRRVVV